MIYKTVLQDKLLVKKIKMKIFFDFFKKCS